jgi:phage gp29-like protein
MGLFDDYIRTPLAELARRAYEILPSANTRSTKIIAADPWTGRDATQFGAALTPQFLLSLIAERNSGHMMRWIDLCDEMREKDPHLQSQLSIREESVVETRFEITPGLGSNQRAAQRAADAARELFSYWQQRSGPSGESSCAEQWVAEWTSAKFYGRFAHELLWTKSDGELVLLGAEKIDTRRLSYACDRYDPRPWALRLHDQYASDSPYDGRYGVPIADLPAEKILVCLPRVRGSQPVREGMASTLIWYLLFKIWSIRDVMALAEMIGRPPVVGYYLAGGAKADGDRAKFNGAQAIATSEDIAALRKAVNAVSGSLRAALPDTTKLDTLDVKHPAGEPVQLLLAKLVDGYTSKVVHGVANLSDLQPGARAAVEAQERTTYTFWRSDVRNSARMFQRMLALYIRSNPQRFGEDCPLPIVEGKTDGAKDLETLGRGLREAQDAGIEVPRAWAHRTLGIPEPVTVRGQKEPILERAKPAAPKVADPTNNSGADPNNPPPSNEA